jgi:hypothetical protein
MNDLLWSVFGAVYCFATALESHVKGMALMSL